MTLVCRIKSGTECGEVVGYWRWGLGLDQLEVRSSKGDDKNENIKEEKHTSSLLIYVRTLHVLRDDGQRSIIFQR